LIDGRPTDVADGVTYDGRGGCDSPLGRRISYRDAVAHGERPAPVNEAERHGVPPGRGGRRCARV